MAVRWYGRNTTESLHIDFVGCGGTSRCGSPVVWLLHRCIATRRRYENCTQTPLQARFQLYKYARPTSTPTWPHSHRQAATQVCGSRDVQPRRCVGLEMCRNAAVPCRPFVQLTNWLHCVLRRSDTQASVVSGDLHCKQRIPQRARPGCSARHDQLRSPPVIMHAYMYLLPGWLKVIATRARGGLG